jgi:hypothetical protein
MMSKLFPVNIVVGNTTPNPKIKGLNPATGTVGRKVMAKAFWCLNCASVAQWQNT